MVDACLFNSHTRVPVADTTNVAGGVAYRLDDKERLAQLACTGCLGATYYLDARTQLNDLIAACNACEPEWVGRVAAYARRHGHMKDAPAALAAWLAVTAPESFERWAPSIIDNGRMVRNLVQILRSTVVGGRKSLPQPVRRFIRTWLNNRGDRALLNDSVGRTPSIGDIIRMVRPKPHTDTREALYRYIIGKDVEAEKLPSIARQLVAFHSAARDDAVADCAVPSVDFRLLTGRAIPSKRVWSEIALAANWQALRMNLNTFQRHGVFGDPGVVARLASKLSNDDAIRRARVWPTQLWSAWKATATDTPWQIREAIQHALDVSVESVPVYDGGVIMCPDDSGSMASPLTGSRGHSTSVSCAEAAAVITFAVAKRNPGTAVLKFADRCERMPNNWRDSIVTNVERYCARLDGGGTNLSLPLELAERERIDGRLVWYVSDNAAWLDATYSNRTGTACAVLFAERRRRIEGARLVLQNVQPHGDTQAKGEGVLNVGGFSDSVFQVVGDFVDGKGSWVDRIASAKLLK